MNGRVREKDASEAGTVFLPAGLGLRQTRPSGGFFAGFGLNEIKTDSGIFDRTSDNDGFALGGDICGRRPIIRRFFGAPLFAGE